MAWGPLGLKHREDEAIYRGTSLHYTKAGALWFAIEQTWDEDDPYCNTGQVLNVTEFRGGRLAQRLIRLGVRGNTLVLDGSALRWSPVTGRGRRVCGRFRRGGVFAGGCRRG